MPQAETLAPRQHGRLVMDLQLSSGGPRVRSDEALRWRQTLHMTQRDRLRNALITGLQKVLLTGYIGVHVRGPIDPIPPRLEVDEEVCLRFA